MNDEHNRRRYRRFSLRLPVSLLGDDELQRLKDLSESGLFVECDTPRPVGTPLPIRLVHPNTGELIPAICKVVRQVFHADGTFAGLGLRFANTDNLLGAKIRRLLAELADASSDPPMEPVETDFEISGTLATTAMMPADVAAEDLSLSLDDLELVPGAADYRDTGKREALAAQIVDPYSAGDAIDVDLSDLNAPPSVTPEAPAALAPVTPATVAARYAKDGPERSAGPQLGLWDRARTSVTEALAAERAGRPQDAARLLETALTLRPPNAADIHARLALLGLGALADLAFAERHAHAALAFSGDRPQIRRLLRAVQAQRARLGPPADAQKTPPAPAPSPRPAERTGAPRRAFAMLVALVIVIAVVGFNVWKYVLPWTRGPESIDVALISELVPATSAVVMPGRLVATIIDAEAWTNLADRQTRLEQLATWAKASYGVGEVVVADTRPQILGRAYRGTATVYR
ncbi:MAG: PilZ domain-containing protein [Deltaproteobacteria bacterium]|nr:PilZ domain-containing protein [Deltaproteobacteria bacterium]